MLVHSFTEFAPKSPFLCVNRSPIRYGFRVGPQAILYSVSMGRPAPIPNKVCDWLGKQYKAGDITMLLFLKIIGSAGYRDQ